MQLRLLLFCWLCIGFISQTLGQEDIPENLFLKKNFVFYNITSMIDPNGASLQFGYNYQVTSWIDLQMELGFVSDNLIPTDLPFDEYAGFRIRPQIKLLSKTSIAQTGRWYGGILLSYQQLNFKENNNFEVEGSFNQNITYRGQDQTFAWYLVGGIDTRSTRRIVVSFSIGIGKVYLKTDVTEGDIPENANILGDCVVFCGRDNFLSNDFTRTGFLIDLKIGYQF